MGLLRTTSRRFGVAFVLVVGLVCASTIILAKKPKKEVEGPGPGSVVYLPFRLMKPSHQMPPCLPLTVTKGTLRSTTIRFESNHELWGKIRAVSTSEIESEGWFSTFEECARNAPEYEGRFDPPMLNAVEQGELTVGMPAEFALIVLGPPENALGYDLHMYWRPAAGVSAPRNGQDRSELGSISGNVEINDLSQLSTYVWGPSSVELDDAHAIAAVDIREQPNIVLDESLLEETFEAHRQVKYAAGMSFYEQGDHAAAFEAWLPLAKGGYAPAQYTLADLFYHGEGVERNLESAVEWYGRAARNNYPPAQYQLGILILKAEGLPTDPVLAYRWMDSASKLGHQAATEVLERLAERMRPEELESARQLIEETAFTVPEIQTHVEPIYPALARTARMNGLVVLTAAIDEEGRVGDAEVVDCTRKGVGFEEAAVDAVSQWRYIPATVGGEPVSVYFAVVVSFTLN